MECIKFIMFGFNIVFWLAGATMLGVGIWLAVDPGAFESLGAAESAGMDNDLWAAAVYTFIAIGALVFLVGFLGCWGACISEDSSVPLWIYSVLVGLCLIAEIVLVIITAVYWTSADDEVAQSMQNDVQTKYVNETSSDAISTSWNTMQQEWECCGSYGPEDYGGSVYDNSHPAEIVPYTCCKDIEDQANCDRTIIDSPSIYQKGCYDALKEFLDENAPIIIGVTCGFAALQIIGLIFACCLIHKKSDEGKYV